MVVPGPSSEAIAHTSIEGALGNEAAIVSRYSTWLGLGLGLGLGFRVRVRVRVRVNLEPRGRCCRLLLDGALPHLVRVEAGG